MSSPVQPKNPHQSQIHTPPNRWQQVKANEIQRWRDLGWGARLLVNGCSVWLSDYVRGQKTYDWIFDSKATMRMGWGIMTHSVPKTVALPIALYGAYKAKQMLKQNDKPDAPIPKESPNT